MALALLFKARMRLKALLVAHILTLLVFAPLASFAQETEAPDGARINSAQVSGLEIGRLSPGLREDIGKLTGTSLNREQLQALARRIEEEQPRYVAAIRTALETDGGARVTFVVARIRDENRDTDVNSRYIVDKVDVRGVPERDLSADLQKDLQALSGKPLDSDAADAVRSKLKAEFPNYDVERRTVRADERGHINLTFVLTRPDWARWLRYEPIDANALYHSDQGWGAVLPLTVGGRDFHVMPYIAWDTADDLVEEYSGFGVRAESRRLGTDRVGMLFEWSTFDQTWRNPTLAALALNPQIPGPYRNRMSVTPLLKFAITPQFSVAGGVGITELDPLIEELRVPSQMANVAIGSVRFKQQWGSGPRFDHEVGTAFTVRTGTRALESDFSYDRYLGEADYQFRSGERHRVFVSGMFGRINGNAPLFERFTLGDSRTLRGWDKYDISPAGGNRMFHTSLEYRFHDVMLFVDGGSVWNTGADRRIRFSTGAGFTPGPLFFTVGFPINTDEFHAVFTTGFRFGISSTGVRKF